MDTHSGDTTSKSQFSVSSGSTGSRCDLTPTSGYSSDTVPSSADVSRSEPFCRKRSCPKKSTANNAIADGMKSLIPSSIDASPLGAFSPFLSCIRGVQASEDSPRSKRSIKSYAFRELKNEPCVKSGEGFCAAISLHDGTTLHVTSTVTNILGYPKDMLLGQCIINFIYPRDRLTFASQLTHGLNAHFPEVDKAFEQNEGKNTFYCRIRQYHSLNISYSLDKKPSHYLPFRITCHMKDLHAEDACVEDIDNGMCLIATAVPIESAYKVRDEIPAMTPFSTRHTANCHFTHVDSSAIPYLGYLPQDMIGCSIFDFYHTDDMPQLKDIYELVVKEQGCSFRSKPYRFRVFNGHYILLETEWSCFINPWSRRLEFVLGQHRVLKGPTDPDVFAACNEEDGIVSEEICKESKRIQEEIKNILKQPIKNYRGDVSKQQASRRKCRLASFVSGLVDELGQMHGQEEKGSGKKEEECSCSDQGSVVMGEISPHQEFADSDPSTETPPSFQEIRYQENIERFFASQPKTYSSTASGESKSEERNTPNVSTDGSEGGKNSGCSEEKSQSAGYVTGYNSTGSDGSSLPKRKMSSTTTGDSGNCSVNAKEGMQPASSSSGGGGSLENYPPCLALTEEVLSQHNRLTHKYFKQRKGKIPSSGTKKEGHRLKRSSSVHSPDVPTVHRKHKHSRQHEVATTTTQTEELKFPQAASVPLAAFSLSPPFSLGLPVVAQPPPVATCAPQTAASRTPTFDSSIYTSPIPNFAVPAYTYTPPSSSAATNPGPFFVPVMYMGALPVYPSIPQMMPPSSTCCCGSTLPDVQKMDEQGDPATVPCSTKDTANSETKSKTDSATAPVTQNAGSADVSQGENQVHPSSPSHEEPQHDEGEKVPMERDCDRQDVQEDSVSASFTSSLLKSDGFSNRSQSADSTEELDGEQQKESKGGPGIRHRPPWMEGVDLNPNVIFCYQMASKNMEEVLKKDLEALKLMQQSDLVNEQLAALQSELEENAASRQRRHARGYERPENPSEAAFAPKAGMNLGFTTLEDDVEDELAALEDNTLQLIDGDI